MTIQDMRLLSHWSLCMIKLQGYIDMSIQDMSGYKDMTIQDVRASFKMFQCAMPGTYAAIHEVRKAAKKKIIKTLKIFNYNEVSLSRIHFSEQVHPTYTFLNKFL